MDSCGNLNCSKDDENNKNNLGKLNINQRMTANDIFNNLQMQKRIKNNYEKINITDRENKSNIKKKKNNYKKNIDKICRIIFQQNKKGNLNLFNNDKKTCIDNNNIKKKQIKTNEILNNSNNSYNDIQTQSHSSRYKKIIQSINNFNISNIRKKIINKAILSKKINCYFIPNKLNISKNINSLKHKIRNSINLMNDKMKKNKIIQRCRNLSPEYINSITYENIYSNNININNFKKFNKANKINIFSPNQKIKKRKIINESNLYNIFLTEKDLYKKMNINYIPKTSRHNKPNRSRNENLNNNKNKFESNTVFIDLSNITKNNLLSTNKTHNKKIIKEFSSQKNDNNTYSSNLKHKNNDKFIAANTEMTLYQITNKINQFCIENNLICIKEGIYNIKIYNKNYQNFFRVEIVYSSPMNIVKIFHEKNAGNNMKDIIKKLFIEIIQFE